MSIEIRHLVKRYGPLAVCDDLSLDIPSGELVALLGPSGSGKTTLLRLIAGLERPDAGTVLFHGEDTTRTSVRDRRVGFVFQHYALFGHLTLAENVAFGLRVRPRASRPPEREIRDRVARLLDLVQLGGLADRHPHQLSGGQRQRVALARALAVEPRVLLLDEPFGALDARVRKELRRWLRRLHDEMHITSVFVTHDQEEAMEVADRVVLMHGGRVVQQGSPDDLWDRPASPFVLEFLGEANRVDGHYVRPHDIDVLPVPADGSWPATLDQVLSLGPRTRLSCRRDDGACVDVELPRDAFLRLKEGGGGVSEGRVHLRARKVTRFDAGVR